MTRLLLVGSLFCLALLLWDVLPPEPTAAQGQPPAANTWKASGKNGAVAAGGQEAVDAGLEILRAGGNAADAAVAVTLVMTVIESPLVTLGGEIPILHYNARTGGVEVLCGQGAAPRLATREHFAKKGGIPPKGAELASIPGTLDACLTLLDRHGTRRFADVAAPALRLLER